MQECHHITEAEEAEATSKKQSRALATDEPQTPKPPTEPPRLISYAVHRVPEPKEVHRNSGVGLVHYGKICFPAMSDLMFCGGRAAGRAVDCLPS